jgi:excisionase family DNA binding protein
LTATVRLLHDARMDTSQEKQIRLLITKREAASALSVSIRTIENFIRRKELAARKIGRRTLIPLASLESFARRDHASPLNGHGSR